MEASSPKRSEWKGTAVLGAVLLLVFLLDRYALAGLSPYYRLVLIFAATNALLAASLNLVNGVTGLFSLGHAGFMACGAFATAGVLTAVAGDPWFTALWNQPFALGSALLVAGFLLFGGLVAALFGLLVGIPTLSLKGDYLAIATLGFGEIVRVLINNLDALGGPRGIRIPDRVLVDGYLFPTFAVTGLSVLLLVRLVRSNRGLGYLTVREDEIAAESLGISTARMRIEAFVIASFFAGVAGALFAFTNTIVYPNDFQFMRSVEIVLMVVLGGMGSFAGSVAAAVLVTVGLEALRYTPLRAPEWRLILYGILLIIVMLARPQGLIGPAVFGKKRREPDGGGA